MKLALASTDDAQALNDLLNIAYRGEQGWTTESRLIAGDRSSVADVILSIEHSILLVYKIQSELVACIGLEVKGRDVYMGSFAVHPDHQSSGVGKCVLALAERYAVDKLKAEKCILFVVSERTELIAFYLRRGYQRTSVSKQYPLNANVGVPKSSGLMIEQLCKYIVDDFKC